jgi:excisionase family DNA binding protein
VSDEPNVVMAYTVAETARLLNVSARTVRRAIDAGRLGVVRIGRCLRVPRLEILKLLSCEAPNPDCPDHDSKT